MSAQIRNDKRFYTPARLVNNNVAWPIEVFWDSGATSSLIRADTLTKFRDLVENEQSGTKLQIIKIKQQDFAGAFSKSSAKANTMVQLDIKLPQTNGRTITLRHKFFVINKMNKPLVVGQDLLMKHRAFTRPSMDGKKGTLMLQFDPESPDVVEYDAGRSKHKKQDTVSDWEEEQPEREELSAQHVTHPREDPRIQVKESPKRNLSRRQQKNVKKNETKKELRRKANRNATVIDDAQTTENIDNEEKIIVESADPRIDKILKKHADLFNGELGLIRGYVHTIQTRNQKPEAAKSYPVPLKFQDKVARQIREMEELGVIAKEATEHINPLVVVHKPNGELRLCLDARAVNSTTRKDYAQPPTIDEVLALMGRESLLKIRRLQSLLASANRQEIPKIHGILVQRATVRVQEDAIWPKNGRRFVHKSDGRGNIPRTRTQEKNDRILGRHGVSLGQSRGTLPRLGQTTQRTSRRRSEAK